MNQRALEAGARALREAEVGYHLRLTRLIDGVSTYTLTYDDGSPPIEFDNMDDGYAHIAAKKSEAQFKAVITAYESHLKAEGFVVVPVIPTQAMLDAGYYPAVQRRGAKSTWQVMLSAATTGENDASE